MSAFDYGDDRRRVIVGVAGGLVVVALLAGTWLLSTSGSGGTATPPASIEVRSSSVSSTQPTVDSTRSTAPLTTASTPTTRAPTRVITTTPAVTTPTRTRPVTPAATPAPTSPSTTQATASTTAATASQAVSYDTLPDGSPAPVLAIFDVDQITLSGAVPSQAAKDRLEAIALANAKPGQGNIVSFVTINPDVPVNIGTRVIELTSARFPEGTADILPEHALELDRVVSVMAALPGVTTLVIGHADQRGDDARNYELSAARAAAVVDYLVSNGVSPDRLSSRAVGETDLLTLNDDDAALALNRRTEFVFDGLLMP